MVQPRKNKEKEKSLGKVLLRNIVIAVSVLIICVVAVQLLLGIITRHGNNKDVPNFIGSNLEQAEKIARHGRFQIIVNDSLYVPVYGGGVILEQRPSAGREKVKSGRKIYVTVNAMRQKMVTVPYVAGFSLRQAASNLLKAGLEIDRLEYVRDMANGYVLSQKFRGEPVTADQPVTAPVGSQITLVVGQSDEYYEQLPDLTGMTLREAKTALWDKGFNLGNVEFDGTLSLGEQNAARVYLQYPSPEHTARVGSDISLRLKPEE